MTGNGMQNGQLVTRIVKIVKRGEQATSERLNEPVFCTAGNNDTYALYHARAWTSQKMRCLRVE